MVYNDLIDLLETVDDAELLNEAEQSLTGYEEEHPELLRSVTPYLIYLPEDRSAVFDVCVAGSDGHVIAHMIDRLYANATVWWIANTGLYDETYDGRMDVVVFSEKTARRAMTETSLIEKWGRGTLKPGGRLLMMISGEQSTVGAFYNACNCHGFAVDSIDSNHMAVARKTVPVILDNDRRQRYDHIYVLCPVSCKSGGAELLHQLVYWINAQSGNAEIAYMQWGDRQVACHPEYADYVAGHIIRKEDIVDSENNAVIVPEGWTNESLNFRHTVQYLWWLSVDNYLVTRNNDPEDARRFLATIDRKAHRHLVQSAYARDYLIKNGVDNGKIGYLSDYINQTYLDHEKDALRKEKKDLILYNPKKGAEYVQALVDRAPDLPWRPIQGLTTIEAGELMRSAKVYIDFGNHPGKDRIPREAAMSGCVVITGRRGAAAFREDVPIPEKYKLSEEENTCEDVLRMIRQSLADYETAVSDFADYRKRIAAEKEQFIRDVRDLFFV
ncbi:MAG: hypothetical protein K6G16_00865 [Lachnospiraceae bacterium]|nr:hypothetical protein [Lachnospiraceae bacterium]